MFNACDVCYVYLDYNLVVINLQIEMNVVVH